MRVVQINATYGIGSTGNMVRDLHRHLQTKGVESHVFYGSLSSENGEFIHKIGNTLDHKLHALLLRLGKKHGEHSKAATKKLCRQLSALSPDVVHLHNLHSNYINLKILLSFLASKKIPVVVTLHDCWFYTGACMHYRRYGCDGWQTGCGHCPAVRGAGAQKWLAEKAEWFGKNRLAVVGVSQWVADDAKRSILKNAQIIRHIYNWIDTGVFYPRKTQGEKFKSMFGIPRDRSLLLGVSQGWSEEKGLGDFIFLANQLAGAADIILVGGHGGAEHPENLHFLDYIKDREELAELYSAADVFVNPSQMETFGLVTAEAMACGTPVVAYANTGSKELVNERCGKLAQTANRQELLEGVNAVLAKPKNFYSAACVEYVASEFSKERQMERYFNVYQEMVQ